MVNNQIPTKKRSTKKTAKKERVDEFQFIKKLLAPLATTANSISLSDDIAILGDKDLVFSTDTICEDIHFLKNTPPNKIAEKLLRVNISDLAAKGVHPKYYSLNLSLDPSNISKEWLESFISGLSKIQNNFGISLLGGDTTKTKKGSVFSATIFGQIKKKYIKRSGAKIGDLIFVTGYLGDSFLGLEILKNQIVTSSHSQRYFTERYEIPNPRVEIINLLLSVASSSIDISDGIFQDLGHILHTSSCGANIIFNDIPISNNAEGIISQNNIIKEKLISHGDDYEILFTAPEKSLKTIKEFCSLSRFPITNIGVITEKKLNITSSSPISKSYLKNGYKHFTNSY